MIKPLLIATVLVVTSIVSSKAHCGSCDQKDDKQGKCEQKDGKKGDCGDKDAKKGEEKKS
jgi:hypothetical protein